MSVLIDDLRIIELKELFAKTRGHQLHEFVSIFRETAKVAVNTLDDPTTSKSLEEIRLEAHRLKGVSLNIGAPALAELAAWIETKAKAGERGALASIDGKLKALHAATLTELNAVLKLIL